MQQEVRGMDALDYGLLCPMHAVVYLLPLVQIDMR